MSARSAFSAAMVLAAMAALPADAQEPPQAPEQQEAAPPQVVERSRSPRREAANDDAPVRAPRAREDSGAQEARPRVRPAVEAPPAASVPAAFEEEQQGGRRRPGGRSGNAGAANGGRIDGGDGGARPRSGGVRRPDGGPDDRGFDGGRDGANRARQAVPRGRAPQIIYAPSYGRRYYAGTGGLGYYFYDPWSWYAGFGGSGYGGYGYYGAPWAGYYGSYYGGYGGYGGGYGGYGNYGNYGGPYGWSIGGVRVKVNPKDAEVYVDGYYAGIVDDFDGMWQQLRLDDGGYRIEIRKPGMSPLTFDVRVQPGRTITYRGEMTTTP